ncbi:carbohydrate ABC transporter permease [Ktedonospora formicarum]|uniref:Sugar ABC transporter permease n=1 Tax=Ktedonospora formicarum TaxID=2778364 RepID=A0A8J3MWT9_9CHLR|nr:sugar ABC transporter permease [Ktedonospora formicarum]GHO49018.1 sugar ABC transporter permease [Ktedonospora formicarum]
MNLEMSVSESDVATKQPDKNLSWEQGNRKSAMRRKRWNRREALIGYLFILPSIIGFTVFVLYPMVMSVYYSLTKWDGVADPVFVGLQNFVYMFTKDPSFVPTLKATALFALLSVPSSLIVGLLLAVLLNRNLPGIKLFRTALYLPAVLPSVATLTLWKFIYNPQYGLANEALDFLHLPTSSWLSSYTMAMPSIVIVGLWGIGSTMIIFLAGLQAVPKEIQEAAQIDGAGPIRLFLHTTLPMISPIIFLQLVLQIIGALQAFNQFNILSSPAGFTTEVLMVHIYHIGFGSVSQFPQLGYATAQVWVLFIIIMVVTIFTFRLSSMWVYEDSSID